MKPRISANNRKNTAKALTEATLALLREYASLDGTPAAAGSVRCDR
ncbi:hypothetical protein R6V09_32875 [Streptomyces sp. W16]|nr:hypothetical protein [Streptomyces sp. W16]MDV9174892.1 hypothetical protein [Streptomyces sp. W16]